MFEVLHPSEVPEAVPWVAMLRLHPFERQAGSFVFKAHQHTVLALSVHTNDASMDKLASSLLHAGWAWVGGCMCLTLHGRGLATREEWKDVRNDLQTMSALVVYPERRPLILEEAYLLHKVDKYWWRK